MYGEIRVRFSVHRGDVDVKKAEVAPVQQKGEKRFVGRHKRILCSDKKMGKARNWTAEEKQYLEDNWGNMSINHICKKLNRSRNAINNMTARLHLGPFLENGDYISFNQLKKAIGITHGSYLTTSWVKNREFPIHTKVRGSSRVKVVYLEEFWKWAEKNRDLLDFSKFEENVLGGSNPF